MIIPWAKLLLVLFIILSVVGEQVFVLNYGKHMQKTVDQIKIDNERLDAEDAVRKAADANDELRNSLEVQKNERDNAVNYLLEHPPVGRVLIPTCVQTADHPVASASGGQLPATGSTVNAAGSQQLLDNATASLRAKAAEFGRAISACKVMQDYEKSKLH